MVLISGGTGARIATAHMIPSSLASRAEKDLCLKATASQYRPYQARWMSVAEKLFMFTFNHALANLVHSCRKPHCIDWQCVALLHTMSYLCTAAGTAWGPCTLWKIYSSKPIPRYCSIPTLSNRDPDTLGLSIIRPDLPSSSLRAATSSEIHNLI